MLNEKQVFVAVVVLLLGILFGYEFITRGDISDCVRLGNTQEECYRGLAK